MIPARAIRLPTSDKAVYLSDEVAAVAYGGTEADSSITVLVSGDKGKTWSSTRVAEAGADHAETKFLLGEMRRQAAAGAEK